VVLPAAIGAQQAVQGNAPVEGFERAGIDAGLGGIEVREQLKFATLHRIVAHAVGLHAQHRREAAAGQQRAGRRGGAGRA
nr:hypothetical protein [Tanacetum cinerariifolium]